MRRSSSIFILAFFLALTITAQETGRIQGTVKNYLDDQIEHIEVRLVQLQKHAYTDADGHFVFTNVPPGDYSLYPVYDGFSFTPKKVNLQADKDLHITLNVGYSAQQLDEVFIQTRTKSELLKNSAIKAEIITIEEHSRRANSVEDIVNRSPGVKIRNVGGLGSRSNIVVGGFTGNSVKFLYDNIPIDYLGSNYGLTKVPTNSIKRVEIYKGVLPTKIGVDALGSAINIIPKRENETSGTLSYETGSYHTHITSVNANIKLNKHLFIGTNSFFNYSRNNYKVDNLPYRDPETGQTTYIRAPLFHNAFRQRSLEFSLQGRALSWADLIELKINSYDLNKEIQNDPYSRSRPFGQVYRRERGNFIPSLKYKNYFFDNRLNVNQFLVYSHIDYELFDRAKNTYYDWKGKAHHNSSSSEMGNLLLKNGYLHNKFDQFTSRTYLSYLFNSDFQVESNTVYSHYNRQSNNDALNPEGTKYNKLITSAALDSHWLDQKLEAKTQVKYLYGHIAGHYQDATNPLMDHPEYKEVTNWGVSFSQAVKYNLNAHNYIRASFENTYRLPDQRELFGDNNFIVANFDLVPEKSKNFNLGYAHLGNKFSYEINTYYRNTKNLIRLKALNQYQAQNLNLDHVRGLGVELQATYKPLDYLEITGNLTYNDFRLQSSRDKALGNQHFKNARIANMPFYFGNLSVSYNVRKLFNMTTDLLFYWNYSYVHQYYLDFIEKQFEPDGFLGLWGKSKIHTSRIIPIQQLHNVGMVYKRDIGQNSVSFSLELRNVFNYKIYNQFKMQSPGRNFRVKISYSF